MSDVEEALIMNASVEDSQDKPEVDDLEGSIKDVELILKRSEKVLKASGAKFEEQSKMLSEKIEELDLYIHALERIPSAIEDKIMSTVPIIAKEITAKHMQYLEEFKQHINSCNNAIDVIKAKLNGIQYWYYKKALATIGIATIIAILTSISTIYIMFKNNPPKHETRILKANDVHADGIVHIFDMTGKFCGKITMPPEKK